MTGAMWAAVAGVGFGFFQAFNRMARKGFNVYWATFSLLFVSSIFLAIAGSLTEDLATLLSTPPLAILNFGLAGFIHFFVGWTLLTESQNRVGAARTGALVGATPLFATIVAILVFGEILSFVLLLGVATVVLGVYFVSISGKNELNISGTTWRDSLFGLGTALCFSLSAIFIRNGLQALPSPLLGVLVSVGISTIAYAILLFIRRDSLNLRAIPHDSLLYQIAAAIFVGISTWMKWVALGMAPVAVVLALGRLNVPVVIALSLFMVGQTQEQVTARVWLGAALIVAGSLLLIFCRT